MGLDEPDSVCYASCMRPYCITDDTRELAVELGISDESALEHEQEVWDDENPLHNLLIRLDEVYRTGTDSPLHHNNRWCPCKG